jgi:hypothetical protein
VEARAARPFGVLVTAWVGAVLALGATRPHTLGPPATWSGEQVARLACWALLAAYATWLTVVFAWSVVVANRGVVVAQGMTRWAPPFVRRAMRAALAGTLAVAPTTLPPVTLHVGPDGHLSGGREPASTRPTTPRTTPTSEVPRVARAPRPDGAPRPRQHRVITGENLWTIARAELALRNGRELDDREIAPYWSRVVAVNRATLRSGDPNLIYPGEIVSLPTP